MVTAKETFNAWHPGLSSEIPPRLMPQVTLFRPENSTVDYAAAKEAASFCGLKPADMAALRPERLIVHELLIRVTADLSVPDGPNYEELGLNLRGMVARIFEIYVTPDLPKLTSQYETLRQTAEAAIRARLARDVFAPPPPTEDTRGFFARLTGKPAPVRETAPPETAALATWQADISSATGLEAAVLRSLITVAGGIVSTHGRLLADADMITRFALNMVMNTHGSAYLGTLMEPYVRKAAEAEGYRFLPVQAKPLIMNVKGASASGKSTIRPRQRALAETLDVPWEDFALISPDYWRKYLADYESLGDDRKYGAMLTGQELEMIDKKLDLYISEKAQRAEIPHLLVDRFRFDSFTAQSDGTVSSRLLTRFGDTVFLFFLITPPKDTVERAWSRGLSTGRYKAVDDLLYHNIEAYTGMPQLFFSFLGSDTKKIHFEFLDNSVPKGALPRTIAYGWNDQMTILDEDALHNIDRFRAVNVDATRPEDVLTDPPLLTFVSRCVAHFKSVTFVDPETLAIRAVANDGDRHEAASGDALSDATYDRDRSLTLGEWGR